MTSGLLAHLRAETEQLKATGLYKEERVMITPQSAAVEITPARHVLNFCANNYLGLADDPAVVAAAKQAADDYGFGMASVRFICGTQTIHKRLEQRVSAFLGTEDTILYSSCFDANAGLFETLLGPEDAIISDALNHASIIDGIRLCKAKRYRYKNNDMQDLEAQLQAADRDGARFKMIATDGVFSMDGIIANLKAVCDLAERYQAILMVDDSHAVGFLGAHGRGTAEFCEVLGRVDIFTGTFGKALGGASGGYVSARKDIVEWLRNRSRPYLFSNSVCPIVVGATLKVFDLLEERGATLRQQLQQNSEQFRAGMTAAGFRLIPGQHPIIPVMLGEATLAADMANRLLARGIYVVGFSYPVVPMGQARIRVQISAAHTPAQIDQAIQAFIEVGRELSVIE